MFDPCSIRGSILRNLNWPGTGCSGRGRGRARRPRRPRANLRTPTSRMAFVVDLRERGVSGVVPNPCTGRSAGRCSSRSCSSGGWARRSGRTGGAGSGGTGGASPGAISTWTSGSRSRALATRSGSAPAWSPVRTWSTRPSRVRPLDHLEAAVLDGARVDGDEDADQVRERARRSDTSSHNPGARPRPRRRGRPS